MLKANTFVSKTLGAFFHSCKKHNAAVIELAVRDKLYLENEAGDGLYDIISFHLTIQNGPLFLKICK